MSDLEYWLAAQAKGLGLDALNVESADPEAVRQFCQQVLNELAARGVLGGAVLGGTEEIGCYAAMRERAN